MSDDDPLALFFLAQRAHEDAARETRILEEARDEALLDASQRLSVAELAATTGLSRQVIKRMLARARARCTALQGPDSP